LADVYVAEKVGYPEGSPADTKSVWEIAFSSPSYFSVASSATEVLEPISLSITIPVSWTYFCQYCSWGCQLCWVMFHISM